MNSIKKTSPLEKTVFFAGLLILIGLLGYLVFQTANDRNSPASLKIEISPQLSASNCVFKVTIENKGGTTAEAVQINFDLYQTGKPVASTTATIDYVPVRSTETLWIVFYNKKENRGTLKITSCTYVEP